MNWRGCFHPFLTFLFGINVGLAIIEIARSIHRHPKVWG